MTGIINPGINIKTHQTFCSQRHN